MSRDRDDTIYGANWNTQTISWRARILPYIEQAALHDNVDYEIPRWWDGDMRPNTNWDIVAPTVVPTFRCPSDPGNGNVTWTAFDGVEHQGHPSNRNYATTNYFGCTGPDAYLRWDGRGLGFFDGIHYRSPRRPGDVKRFRDVTDGLSSTIAVSEGIIGHPRVNQDDGTKLEVLGLPSK